MPKAPAAEGYASTRHTPLTFAKDAPPPGEPRIFLWIPFTKKILLAFFKKIIYTLQMRMLSMLF